MSNNRAKDQLQVQSQVFLTEGELAARWRHSLRSLQRWRAEGNGPRHLRIGRRTVFRIVDVEDFEASLEIGK